jgi:hypothetical protein
LVGEESAITVLFDSSHASVFRGLCSAIECLSLSSIPFQASDGNFLSAENIEVATTAPDRYDVRNKSICERRRFSICDWRAVRTPERALGIIEMTSERYEERSVAEPREDCLLLLPDDAGIHQEQLERLAEPQPRERESRALAAAVPQAAYRRP